jgi:hypothetical protein
VEPGEASPPPPEAPSSTSVPPPSSAVASVPASPAATSPALPAKPAAAPVTSAPHRVADSIAPPPFTLPWISLEAGYVLGSRWFRHSEPTTGELRNYTAVRLHSAVANIVFYPFERTPLSYLKDLGVTLGYAQAFGVQSKLTGQGATQTNNAPTGVNSVREPGPFATTYRKWDAGLRFRIAAGKELNAWRLAVGAGYRQLTFDFDLAGRARMEVPRARYSIARGSFDVEKSFGPLLLGATASYLVLLGSVTLGDRVSQSLGYGAEGTIGVGYTVVSHVRVRAAVTYTVFRFSLAPLAGRNDPAGVVWDHYLDPFAGAELTF